MGNACLKPPKEAEGGGEEGGLGGGVGSDGQSIREQNKSTSSAASKQREQEDDDSAPDLDFRRYSAEELFEATRNFSDQSILSEGGKQAPNAVFKGRLRSNGRYVAVKIFQGRDWEDERMFEAQAMAVGQVRYDGISRLIGYCVEGHHRMFVAEFMANNTLAQHLFHWETAPMPWMRRLEVAVMVACSLRHLSQAEGIHLYHDLNPYRVLFDENGRPKLSCFGLLKPMKNGEYSSNLASIPPEFYLYGRITSESIVYTFGVFLLALFSGKSIRPNQFLELVENRQDVSSLADSNLVGQPGLEHAMELVPLIAECLKKDPMTRPNITRISDFLVLLDEKSRSALGPLADEVGMAQRAAKMSPLAQAAEDGDFDALYNLMVDMAHAPTQEPSFETWDAAMQELLEARQKGDQAFKARRWREAISLYEKFLERGGEPPVVMLGRKCIAHLQLRQHSMALSTARRMQEMGSSAAESKFLQSVALRKLGMNEDADALYKQGLLIERESAS